MPYCSDHQHPTLVDQAAFEVSDAVVLGKLIAATIVKSDSARSTLALVSKWVEERGGAGRDAGAGAGGTAVGGAVGGCGGPVVGGAVAVGSGSGAAVAAAGGGGAAVAVAVGGGGGAAVASHTNEAVPPPPKRSKTDE